MVCERNSNLLRRITVLFIICGCGVVAQGKYGGGSGTPEDPYQIWDANQMNQIGLHEEDWDKNFRLMADIDLGEYGGTEFNLIGGTLPFSGWSGVFDGDGHTISSFTYGSEGEGKIGIFRSIGVVGQPSPHIKDLGLIDPNVDAGLGDSIGSLVGCAYFNGMITRCYVKGGSVRGGSYVGGLVGHSSAKVSDCYSSTSVSAVSKVGGLLGSASDDSEIYHCYATGVVSGTEDVGGLIGINNGVVISSYWDTIASEQLGSAGGMGRTTSQMQSAATYVGWGRREEPVWRIDEGNDYPRLYWEDRPGKLLPCLKDYLAGDGTESDPYLIYTPQEFTIVGSFVSEWAKYFKLMASIDLDAHPQGHPITIGTSHDPFTGVFDGGGNKISGFSYTTEDLYGVGLFRYIDNENAEIRNLGLVEPNVVGTDWCVGTLVGRLVCGRIVNCYSEKCVVAGWRMAGGLIGCNDGGGSILNSWSSGIVTATYGFVGGLAGGNEGRIVDSYSTASVSAPVEPGGLVGRNEDGSITHCYSSGHVSSSQFSGGLVGTNSGGTVTDSVWDVHASNHICMCGNQVQHGVGCDDTCGKTPVQMMKRATFTDWDFINTWNIGENQTYPYLRTVPAGDINKDRIVNFLDLSILADQWMTEPD